MLYQGRASVEDCGSTLKQNRVDATYLRKVYSTPSDELVLVQRRRSIECMLASTCDGGGRNTGRRYIGTFLLGSFLNYILGI